MSAAAQPWSDEFRAGCVAKEPLTVSEWADRYRVIPLGTSPEAGQWRTSRTPYLKEILDAVSDPTITSITVRAGSQLGKTEVLLCAIGYFASQDPAPMLIVQPNEDQMRAFSKERIATMFASTPVLRGKFSEGARDPANTVMSRQFPGGNLACAYAGSAASLSSRAIRVLMGDEIDRWVDTVGRDGDPWEQAVQRTTTYRRNRKIIAVSTPTVEGASAIDRLYQSTDRRQYHVPCPRCGVFQVLRWSNVIYKIDGVINLDEVHYCCEECGARIDEREKGAMIAAGVWQPGPRLSGEPPTDPAERGYTISAIYSPWVTWRDLASKWIKVYADRDHRGKREFVNLKLGETWREESERISVEALEKNREHFDAEIPDGVLMLTAGVDVQDDRLEAEIVGWGLGRESWGIEYAVITGDTATDDPWHRLDAFLAKTWSRPDKRALGIVCGCIDSGGHRTQMVYEFCRARVARNIYATKGWAGQGRPIVGVPRHTNRARINLYPVGADTGKEAVYSRLALATPGPGYCHFPIGRGYDDRFFRGLVSESRKRKRVNGFEHIVWVGAKGNEPLDIRVLATAALEIMMPDVPGADAYLPALAVAEEKARGAAPITQAQPTQRRRVLSRGVGW